ncbi:MAG: transporter, partial [Candidatus Hydrogenedentes bacterium]|nr:transporter [Candidatus Hydrogenedentota bacterium]
MYAVAFLMDCALMAGFTIVPFFVMRQLGGGERMVGLIAGLQSIAYAAVSLLSAPFVKHAKNGLNWALLGMAGFGVLFSIAPLIREP